MSFARGPTLVRELINHGIINHLLNGMILQVDLTPQALTVASEGFGWDLPY